MLNGKNIILAVTGSIAAYKAAFLVRLLVKKGASVQVIMSESGKQFITPLTLSTLSGNPVLSDFSKGESGEWNNHVELGLKADLFLIAPASANTIGKMAGGICDSLLTAVYLSAKCPVYVAPAMDLDMFRHGSVRANLEKLRSFGNLIIPPGTGELASGLYGEGRMAEPEEIISFLETSLAASLPLNGKKVLITAGPTHEAIDPVRFIGNHSTGKMGFALAKSFADKGAEVVLVSGPVSLETPKGKITRIDVTSAEEMLSVCDENFESCDIAVLSAAVADFAPVAASERKIKKSEGGLKVLELKTTPDILSALGKRKHKNQILVGFALETDNQEQNALKKLSEKNPDMIVMNTPSPETAFGSDTNQVTVFHKDNKKVIFELKPKSMVADDIVNEVIKLL